MRARTSQRPARRSVRTTRAGRVRPVRRRAVQWPMVLWLTLVWWVLWGSYSALSLVGGVLISATVLFAFPLPPLRMQVRIHPVGLTVFVVRFLVDVVVASVEVTRVVLAPPAELRGAIVAVPMRTESDLVLVAVAEVVSLVPGSVVIEAHRPSHTLFVHVLDVRGEDDLTAVRETVWAQERRIVDALGTEPVPPVEPVPSAGAEGREESPWTR